AVVFSGIVMWTPDLAIGRAQDTQRLRRHGGILRLDLAAPRGIEHAPAALRQGFPGAACQYLARAALDGNPKPALGRMHGGHEAVGLAAMLHCAPRKAAAELHHVDAVIERRLHQRVLGCRAAEPGLQRLLLALRDLGLAAKAHDRQQHAEPVIVLLPDHRLVLVEENIALPTAD